MKIGNEINKSNKSNNIFIIFTLNKLYYSSLNNKLTLELNCVWNSWNC